MNALPNTIAKNDDRLDVRAEDAGHDRGDDQKDLQRVAEFGKEYKDGLSFFRPANSFGPYVFSRAAASCWESPLAEVWSAEKISAADFFASASSDNSSPLLPLLLV